MDRRWLFVFAGILLGAAFAVIFFYGLPGTGPGNDPQTLVQAQDPASGGGPEGVTPSSRALQAGSRAISFSLQDLTGEPVNLDDYQGQVVLLNFWATWCGPCRLEMSSFQRRHDELGEDGFTVLAVNFDESVEQVRRFKEELGLSFPILLDPGGNVHRQYRIRGYPTSILIDREGKIQKIHMGILAESQLERYLEEMGLDL